MSTRLKTCPECGFTGLVGKYFGWRFSDLPPAQNTPQSRCLDCRYAYAQRQRDLIKRVKMQMRSAKPAVAKKPVVMFAHAVQRLAGKARLTVKRLSRN